jgi:hypothetical protein
LQLEVERCASGEGLGVLKRVGEGVRFERGDAVDLKVGERLGVVLDAAVVGDEGVVGRDGGAGAEGGRD